MWGTIPRMASKTPNQKTLDLFAGLATNDDKLRVLVQGFALVSSDSTAEALNEIVNAPAAGGPDSPLHKARDLAQVKRDLAAKGIIEEDRDEAELPESDDQLAGRQPVPKDPGSEVGQGSPIRDGGIAANIEPVSATEIEDVEPEKVATG